MTRLWLIRHGQTDWNQEGRWQGQSPLAPGLNAAGWSQARALADQLAGRSFAALYSSDLSRAWQTAAVISARLELRVLAEPRLREISLGAWEGRRATEIAQQHPNEVAARERDPVHSRAPGGESVAELARRVAAAADDLAERHRGADVLVVAHGLALATLLCQAQARPLDQAYDLIPDNAAPMVVTWEAAEAAHRGR